MNNSMSVKTIFEIGFGIMAVAWAAVIIPSPLHDWFMDASIGTIPLVVAASALTIMFTPPFILTTILRKFDVDYDDEIPSLAVNHAAH